MFHHHQYHQHHLKALKREIYVRGYFLHLLLFYFNTTKNTERYVAGQVYCHMKLFDIHTQKENCFFLLLLLLPFSVLFLHWKNHFSISTLLCVFMVGIYFIFLWSFGLDQETQSISFLLSCVTTVLLLFLPFFSLLTSHHFFFNFLSHLQLDFKIYSWKKNPQSFVTFRRYKKPQNRTEKT